MMVEMVGVPPVGQEFRSLREHVYRALLQAIADQRIKPGERLVLDDLAVQLKTSRTPIRDALSRLAAEGLVQPNGRRGFCVTLLTSEDLFHLYDLRLMCELHAVENGIANVTRETLHLLEKRARENARLSASPDPSDRLAQSLADKEFHLLLVRLGQNPRLTELYERLNIHIHSVRAGPSSMTHEERAKVNEAEHEVIMAALRRRDCIATKDAVREHVLNARARAITSLEVTRRG